MPWGQLTHCLSPFGNNVYHKYSILYLLHKTWNVTFDILNTPAQVKFDPKFLLKWHYFPNKFSTPTLPHTLQPSNTNTMARSVLFFHFNPNFESLYCRQSVSLPFKKFAKTTTLVLYKTGLPQAYLLLQNKKYKNDCKMRCYHSTARFSGLCHIQKLSIITIC